MAGPIRILPSEVIDQIAAGEVVERPASVVKELLDNALDAGATQVSIDFEDGGVSLLRVVDNGSGIEREQLPLALERHATSKLQVLDDLQALDTFGFRGEALASIASVSKLTVSTRTREAEVGTRMHVEPGAEPNISDAPHAVGTMMEVRELFFNVPARRKFLKSAATESAHIVDVAVRAALAHPNVRIRLRRDGRMLREMLPSESRQARIETILSEPLVRVEGERNGVRVDAYLAAPEHARNGTQHLHTYVNGRPVRDRALARAAAFAYGTALSAGAFPLGVVYVTLDPRDVDINVHPQKSEVRFADPRRVMTAVTHVLHEGLASTRWPRTSVAPARPESYATTAGVLRDALFANEAPPPRAYESIPPTAGRFARMTVLAITQREHAVCESDDGLCVIDLVALDALTKQDALERASTSEGIACKPLMFPARVPLAREVIDHIDAHAALITRAGFDVARAGQDIVVVHGAADVIDSTRVAAAFEAFFWAIADERETDDARFLRGLSAIAFAAAAGNSAKKRAERARELIGALDALDENRVKTAKIVHAFDWSELDGARLPK